MSIQPRDFLTAARNISSNPSGDEIYYRVSASRAYYSAYHECSSIAVRRLGLSPTNNNMNFRHKELSDQLKRSSNPKVAKVGILLAQAMSLRVKADYQINKSFSKNQSDDALLQAGLIIKKAATLP